jgi:hypothetical protein
MKNNEEENELARIFIASEAKQKLDLYIKHTDSEVSGLGTVAVIENNFLIKDIYLFEQECTGSDTDLSQEDVAKLILESVRLGLDPSGLKLWWHSHVNMSTFWSPTDKATAGRFGNGWMLSIVGNKNGDYLARLDLYNPIRLTIDNLKLEVYQSASDELIEKIKKEIKEKVKIKMYVPAKYSWDNAFMGFRHQPVRRDEDCKKEAEVKKEKKSKFKYRG